MHIATGNAVTVVYNFHCCMFLRLGAICAHLSQLFLHYAAYDYCSHVPIEEQLEALAKVVAQGKVREVRT